jgi:hypothetical protein
MYGCTEKDILDGGGPVPLAATQTNHEAKRNIATALQTLASLFFSCRSFDDTRLLGLNYRIPPLI